MKQSKQYIIDRFEGGYAVCEDEHGVFTDIKKELLPDVAKEGDVLIYKDNEYHVDADKTQQRRQVIVDLQDELFE